MRRVLNIAVMGAALLALASGCGGSAKSADSAKAVRSVTNKIMSGGSSSSLREALRDAKGQMLLAYFGAEAASVSSEGSVGTPDPDVDLGCTPSTTDGDATDGSMAFSTTCTSVADETMTCKDKTYTLSKGATITMDVAVSGIPTGGSQDFSNLAMRFGLDLNAKMSGGELGTGTDFVCKLNFSLSASQMQSGDAQFDCSSGDMKCTVGGEELSCKDIEEAMNDDANACS